MVRRFLKINLDVHVEKGNSINMQGTTALKSLKIDEELHGRIKLEALRQNKTIQQWVTAALSPALPKLNAKVRKGGK